MVFKSEGYKSGYTGRYCFVISDISNSNEYFDQSTAQQFCRSYGTQLIEIKNVEIQNSLVNFIRSAYSQRLNGSNFLTNGKRSSGNWLRLNGNSIGAYFISFCLSIYLFKKLSNFAIVWIAVNNILVRIKPVLSKVFLLNTSKNIYTSLRLHVPHIGWISVSENWLILLQFGKFAFYVFIYLSEFLFIELKFSFLYCYSRWYCSVQREGSILCLWIFAANYFWVRFVRE